MVFKKTMGHHPKINFDKYKVHLIGPEKYPDLEKQSGNVFAMLDDAEKECQVTDYLVGWVVEYLKKDT